MKFYDPFSPGHNPDAPPPSPPVPGIPQWTLTIADLFSLILTFFVMLYSMSGVKEEKWQAMSESLRTQAAQVNDPTSPYDAPPKLRTIEEVNIEQARSLNYLGVIAGKRLDAINGMEGVEVKRGQGRITLSLTQTALFANGTPRKEGMNALAQIAAFLSNIDNAVTVEAYTQPRKSYGTSLSAWEYSLSQAQSIAGMLHKAGYEHPIDIYGMGATAQPENERIDIVIRENVAQF